MIKMKSISKKFKTKEVLKELNFSISQGEIVYIHGTNGCGKSTLLKIIAGILEADDGSIELDSKVKIGALIENPGFLENEKLEYNLKFFATLKNRKDYNENYIKKLCDGFSLDLYDKQKLKTYSVGMRQKAGIIQAIMENQNLILLDEPSRGLDDKSLKFFSKLINELSLESKSIIIASHDKMEDIPFTSCYQLNKGKLIKE